MHIVVKKHSNNLGFVVASTTPVVHPTYEKAETEAKRLSKLHPEDVFFIMFCCASVQVESPPIKVTKYFNEQASCYR